MDPTYLPTCSFPCFGGHTGHTGHGTAHLTVACGSSGPSTSLFAAVQACVLQHCSPADALATARFVADACHWTPRSRRAALVALLAVEVPAVLVLGVRIYGRVTQAARLAVDDYLSFVVAPLFVAFLVVGQYASIAGFGVDVWTVPDATVAAVMQAFYADELLYLVILALLRLSVLFLYLRLFAPPDAADTADAADTVDDKPVHNTQRVVLVLYRRHTDGEFECERMAVDQNEDQDQNHTQTQIQNAPTAAQRLRYRSVHYPRFRVAVLAIAYGLVLAPSVVFLLLDLLQCSPIRTVWTRWTSPQLVGLDDARCLDVRALVWAAAALGIAQDAAILVVPWPLLYVLRASLVSSRASRVRALTGVAMFGLGIFVLATSCVRLHFLVHFSPTTTANPTWDNTDSLIWSGLEVSVSVIVASLPAVRAMVQKVKGRR